MSNFEKLLLKCEELKILIKELEKKPINKNQQTVREIQLRFLKSRLSEIGRQLNYLTLYNKRDYND